LALSELPQFSGLDDNGGRIILADRLDALEFAFDDSKYGRFSEQPVMEITLPSLTGAATAPEGQHVLNANIMYVPGDLREGWTDEARADLLERALALLEQYAPGSRSTVLGSNLLTPADLEEQYGVTGGHWHHTEVALDQMLMMRPTYEAAQYTTPVPGLFICGAGAHPGGDLTGAPGHNAAQAVLT
jgi:phytoene dehydrogenase-like protein